MCFVASAWTSTTVFLERKRCPSKAPSVCIFCVRFSIPAGLGKAVQGVSFAPCLADISLRLFNEHSSGCQQHTVDDTVAGCLLLQAILPLPLCFVAAGTMHHVLAWGKMCNTLVCLFVCARDGSAITPMPSDPSSPKRPR